MSAHQNATSTARIEETTQKAVDAVLSRVGAGRGGPHAEIEAQLRELVDREVHDFAVRVRNALNQSVYDAMEGHMAAKEVVEEVLGPEPPRAPRVVSR